MYLGTNWTATTAAMESRSISKDWWQDVFQIFGTSWILRGFVFLVNDNIWEIQQRAQTIHANYWFHEVNHKIFSKSFKTSEYVQLENINSEACEQTNSALMRITSSTTFMSPTIYMRSLTLFMADNNITANKFKKSILKVSHGEMMENIVHYFLMIWG